MMGRCIIFVTVIKSCKSVILQFRLHYYDGHFADEIPLISMIMSQGGNRSSHIFRCLDLLACKVKCNKLSDCTGSKISLPVTCG